MRILLLFILAISGIFAEKPVVKAVAATTAAPSPGVFRHYFPTTEIALPASYPFIQPQKMRFAGNGLQIDVFARSFAQGQPAYIEIIKLKPAESDPYIYFEGKQIRLTRYPWGFRGLFAISPTIPAPGWKKFKVQYAGKTDEYRLFIQKVNFPVYYSTMYIPAIANNTEVTKPDTAAFIQRCQEKKNRVFSRVNADTFSNRLSFPRDLYRITSPFNAKRVYQRYQMQGKKAVALPSQFHFHTGLDMYAKWGDPIFAMADGTAVIAENMFYEGGFTAVDHGNGIFTMYMHQSKINVREGQFVRAGDLIGLAGATGAATGSHLHVSLFIDWVPLDPMGLLSLPIRN
ncbi:MAG TPA: M23 family metallopeptidase [Leptospiraceae bacterium]|nr:M23 family metallopeptidase [Leptospiraceae bacterium]HMW60470.1 M23 family metallopeptidase [Leptospiraceae bacterium]